jgi:hypothetical protein
MRSTPTGCELIPNDLVEGRPERQMRLLNFTQADYRGLLKTDDS